jgi:cardiolipin synthase
VTTADAAIASAADGSSPDAVTTDRIFTIPNVISFVRLLCVPLFLWLLFHHPRHRAAAAYLLATLGITDFVDGYIARHFNQVSSLGKVLDPLADRLLLGVGVIAILIDGAMPAWIAWVTIVREVGVSVGVLVLAALGARRIDVQWAGKAGTLALMFAFPMFLGGHAPDLAFFGARWADLCRALAWCFVVPGLVLSWYAALTYIPRGREALREGRVDSSS